MASTEVLIQSNENLTQSNEVSKTENRPKLRDIVVTVPSVNANEHALSSPWVFWWLQRGAKTQDEWESSFHLLGAFASVEGFWNYYSAIARPHELKQKLEIYVFRHGMKPLWEDEVNKEGGKFSITTEKHETTEHWERLLLALIGEQLDFGGEVCGIVLSSRWNDDHISIWVKDDKKNTVIKEKVTSFFSNVAAEKISYKAHKDAIVDSAIYEAKMKEKEATNASLGHHQNQNHQNNHYYRHNNQQQHHYNNNNANNMNNQNSQQTTGNTPNSETHQGRSSNKVNRPYIPSYQLGNSSETEKTTDESNTSPDKSRKPSKKTHEPAVVVEKDTEGFTFVKHQRKQRTQTPGQNTEERSSNYRNNNASTGNRGQYNNNASTQSDYQNQKYQQYSSQNTGTLSLYPQKPIASNTNTNTTGANNTAAPSGNSFAALTDQ